MHPPLIIFLNYLLLFLFSRPDKSVNFLNTTFDELEYFFIVSYLLLIRSIKPESTFSSRSIAPVSLARSLCFSINCGTSIVSFHIFHLFSSYMDAYLFGILFPLLVLQKEAPLLRCKPRCFYNIFGDFLLC